MNTLMAKALFKKTTLYATAFVLAVSTLTAAVPFILSKTANAAAPYNLTVRPYCENGLVSFDIKGDNPDSGQPAIYVKSSAAFKLSDAVLAEPGKTASVPLKTDLASVPASAATIFVSSTADGSYTWLNDSSAIASYGAFNCYDTVYVATSGSDANTGTTAAAPFATIQKALDTVNVNGTVYVADGSYYGTANIIKEGTKLIGTTNSRDTVKIYPTALSGQAGLFVNGVNNVTIKNLGVYGDNFVVSGSGALIKLNDGSNTNIENVVVKNSSASGININSYSNVSITNVFVAGAKKDGISVVAQQNTTANSSKDIFINGSTISGAAWSAIAFGTTAKNSDASISNKSITGVTILNTSTQYGERGLYVDGTGGTVTSPSSDKLVLQNFYAGDNTNEYINNEQTADIDARGIRINIGNGVVVPVSQMTQVQYDTTLLKIKDKLNKNPTLQNYGNVQLVNLTTPVLSAKIAGGADLASGALTNKTNVIASWTKPVGAVKFTYKYWNSIPGNQYKQTSPYVVNNITGTSQPGSFTEGSGTHFIQIVAVDALGNETTSNIFEISYDGVAPTSVNDLASLLHGTVQVTQTVGDNLAPASGKLRIWKLVNGVQDNTKYYASADVAVDANGKVAYPLNTLSSLYGDGTYLAKFTSTDTAGNASVAQKTFTVDNTKPTISVKKDSASLVDGSFGNNPYSHVSFKLYDAAGNLKEVVLNGNVYNRSGQWSDLNWTNLTKSQLVEGVNTLVVRDTAGNESELNFVYDSTAPAAPTIDSSLLYVNNTQSNNVASWTHNGTDVDHFEYREYMSLAEADADTDGNTTSYWVQTKAASDRSQVVGQSWTGEQTLYYRIVAVDSLGHRSAPSALGTVIVDKNAPDVTLFKTADSSFTPTFRGTVTDPNAVVTIAIGNNKYTAVNNGDGTWQYAVESPLTPATYAIVVTAKDVALNDATPVTGTLTVALVVEEEAVSATTSTPTTPIPLATVIPTVVPSIVNPSTFAGVLGSTTDNVSNNDGAAVEGTSTKNTLAVAANSDANRGAFLGFNWYWWLLIVAAVAGTAWWIFGAIRNRQFEN